MVYTLHFFSSKCSLFHNSNVFGYCIIHILYTGCAKIKKNNSGAKRLMYSERNTGLLKTSCISCYVTVCKEYLLDVKNSVTTKFPRLKAGCRINLIKYTVKE